MLSFVEHDALEEHAVQHAALLLVGLLPPVGLLARSLQLDRGHVTRI